MLKKGFVVAIEGIDGAGKTTQAKMLYAYLTNRRIDSILSKEPTNSIYGQQIRELAMGKRNSTHPQEEYQLFIQDRKLHVETLIKPALADKKIVILDRYYFSTMAYQGALGLDPIRIKEENEAFSPIPKVVFLITVPPSVGIGRIRNGRKEIPNEFEHEENLIKVASIFKSMLSPPVEPVDGTASIDTIHAMITSRIEHLLANHLP